MSVRDNNKSIIITDALTGHVLQVLDFSTLSYDSITNVINDFTYRFVYEDEHGIMIRVGNKE